MIEIDQRERRIQAMLRRARRRYHVSPVPSRAELEAMIDALPDLRCPRCRHPLLWHARQGWTRTICLTCLSNGVWQLTCLGCLFSPPSPAHGSPHPITEPLMIRPRLLDLFCGAGGCAAGYVRAGFEVHGVDIEPQPRYLLSGATSFTRADALEYVRQHGREFDVIHASPPCQAYSITRHLPTVASGAHPDLLAPTRRLLQQIGRLWIIENVYGAPFRPPVAMLCGLMFGLSLFRHRWFESDILLLAPAHERHGKRRVGRNGFVTLAGHGSARSGGRITVPPDHRTVAAWRLASGIDWMTRDELAQAIPPAYTEYLGPQLRAALEHTHA